MTEHTGVWVIIDSDYGENITSVYATELDALRVLNGRGYGRVAFLEYGNNVRGEVE